MIAINIEMSLGVNACFSKGSITLQRLVISKASKLLAIVFWDMVYDDIVIIVNRKSEIYYFFLYLYTYKESYFFLGFVM